MPSAKNAGDGFSFKDPARKQEIAVTVVPMNKIEVISHQRKASDMHIKRIVASIEKIGFVAPVVAVERDGKFVIIDGQHRYLAAHSLDLKQLPVVVVPEELARRMLTLNVEKEPNIRERSAVALAIYREIVDEEPKVSEDDAEVVAAIDQAHYVTLGLGYEESGRLTGSAFEPILKKCDGFLDEAIAIAYEVRQQRAAKLVEAHNRVKSITAKLKEMGVWHEFVGAQIIGYANPLKRARKQSSFDETFDKLLKKLAELEEHPEKLKSAGGG
jgi:ParB family transcriptional regulator, chromosome partitioning protein